MAYWNDRFPAYVSVAQRKEKAAAHAASLRGKGHVPRPVVIEGRQIAASAWGKAWCEHLESYSDYENRLPRGRTYVRNGSVFDLQIEAGKVRALVSGSDIYRVEVGVRPLGADRWASIVRDTSGRIESAVGLLRGRLDAGVMARMTDRQRGLFPAPREIALKCSCPDVAGLCKHLAATLYGVGARLDREPELLFLLRGVDHQELLTAGAAALTAEVATGPTDDAALGALFGIEIAEAEVPAATPPAARAPTTAPEPRKPAGTARPPRAPAKRKPAPPAPAARPPVATRSRAGRAAAAPSVGSTRSKAAAPPAPSRRKERAGKPRAPGRTGGKSARKAPHR